MGLSARPRKFRMLRDEEINKLMADATPKEGEEATAAA